MVLPISEMDDSLKNIRETLLSFGFFKRDAALFLETPCNRGAMRSNSKMRKAFKRACLGHMLKETHGWKLVSMSLLERGS